jgi:hypothetical protein
MKIILRYFVAGYGNTTLPSDAMTLNLLVGNIDDGIIKMYGVAKS